MRFSFPERSFACAGIDHSGDNGNSAPHPDFIEPGTTHIIRVIGSFIETEAFARGTKSPAGISVHELQHPIILIEAVIQYGSGCSTRPVNHLLLGVFVKFFR